jgi:RNA recognition motif-containing protein
MMDEKKESLGFGFICFKDPDHAFNALKELNGKDGLFVCKAMKKADRLAEIRRQTERYKRSMLKFNLYVKNFPADSTEDELREFFSRFGEVKNVKIAKRLQNAPEEGKEEPEVI